MRDLMLLLLGAAVGIGGSVITIFLQHRLNLKTEVFKKRLEAEAKQEEEGRAWMREINHKLDSVPADELERRKVVKNIGGVEVSTYDLRDFFNNESRK